MEWECVIGLEVHVQLKTKSKIFSGASTTFGADANTQACGVDIGLPGVLPVMNREAVLMAARFGLAIGGAINELSVFARKNYFYPDLPKDIKLVNLRFRLSKGVNLRFKPLTDRALSGSHERTWRKTPASRFTKTFTA